MSTTAKQKEQQAELHSKLWAMANDLRGSMEAYEFKSYILGLIFYRYLSEKVEKCANDLLKDDENDFINAWKVEDYREGLKSEIVDILGYTIAPENLFSSLIKKISESDFDIEDLEKAISAISESSLGTDSQEDFENLFDDMDLKSSKLGKDVKSRSKVLAKVMVNVAGLSFEYENSEIDVLGDAYEYLIGMFAQTAGKKAGEFYTPQQVSKVLAKIVSLGKRELLSVYDPCCGSGSLLLRVGKECKVIKYYGQELTSTTYNLARMNMLLHGVPYQYFHIANGDTLDDPQYFGEQFSAVVANPPYSANWSADSKFLDDDRFSVYGKLAPASKADFAFVQHMLHHLHENGTMAVVLPHGVLFRSGAEEVIRKVLIRDKNALDAIIGLPENLFFGTGIPTCILVFKKIRNGDSGNILFIDASNGFKQGKNQNILREKDIDNIVQAYQERKEVERYSHVATLEEVIKNGYNLNISRYIDNFCPEQKMDISTNLKDIDELKLKSDILETKLTTYFAELGLPIVGKLPEDVIEKLFSQVLRFKNAQGEQFPTWQKMKIGDVYTERSERGKPNYELLSVTMSEGVKKRSEIEGKDNSSEDKGNYKIVHQGDMVYNSMRMWQGANGISRFDGIVSPAYTVLKPKTDIVNAWFGYYFKTYDLICQFKKYSQGLTSDTWNLKYPQLKDISIMVPSLSEQQKIADFLSAFDEKIETEKQILEHWQTIKKGLLQQMFV